jgi:integrase
MDRHRSKQSEWAFTASKTKTPHIVPLARQAQAILRELHPLSGLGPFVFPIGTHERAAHERRRHQHGPATMGIDNKTTIGHGFRAIARTLLDEVLGFRVDLIEAQLAYVVWIQTVAPTTAPPTSTSAAR